MGDEDTASKVKKDGDTEDVDADFTTKPLEVKPDVKAEETKSQNKDKEQV
jgi:sec-independent protein translocase protein TatA